MRLERVAGVTGACVSHWRVWILSQCLWGTTERCPSSWSPMSSPGPVEPAVNQLWPKFRELFPLLRHFEGYKTPQFSYALDGSINQSPLSREQFMTTNSKHILQQQCHFLQYHLQRNVEIHVQGCLLKHCLKKTGKDPSVPVKQIMEPPYNRPLCSCEKRIS